MTLFWKGSWSPSGATLRLSWEAWCSRFSAKHNTKQQFSKSFGMAFGCHAGSFWGGLGPQNGDPKSLKSCPKKGPQKYIVLERFWANLGVHFRAKNCSRRGPKMGPLLEPPCAASQGSRPYVFRNYTRGVEKLLELELYSPKEREGS